MLTFRIKHYPVFILLALFFVLHQSFSLFLPSLISTISHFFKRLDGSFLKPTEAYLQLSTDQQKKKLNIPVTRNFTCQRKIKSTPHLYLYSKNNRMRAKRKKPEEAQGWNPWSKIAFHEYCNSNVTRLAWRPRPHPKFKKKLYSHRTEKCSFPLLASLLLVIICLKRKHLPGKHKSTDN